MIMIQKQTIFALATASGRSGVAVMRISGGSASKAIAKFCCPSETPKPRTATLRNVNNAAGQLIDRALALWFPAPHSFTGEDVVEFHLHGGKAVIHAVIEMLGSLPDFRMAEPGEFTRRAFENGKMTP